MRYVVFFARITSEKILNFGVSELLKRTNDFRIEYHCLGVLGWRGDRKPRCNNVLQRRKQNYRVYCNKPRVNSNDDEMRTFLATGPNRLFVLLDAFGRLGRRAQASRKEIVKNRQTVFRMRTEKELIANYL